jgi:hypothetical protein
MIQSPYGWTISVVQQLSATTFYPSWRTTMDKTLFVRLLPYMQDIFKELRSIGRL